MLNFKLMKMLHLGMEEAFSHCDSVDEVYLLLTDICLKAEEECEVKLLKMELDEDQSDLC